MKTTLLVAFVLFLNPTTDFKTVVKEAQLHNVIVTTTTKTASGVILQDGIILSNFHVLEVDSNIFVNGNKASVLATDPYNDLILLKAETRKVRPIRFAQEELEQIDQIFYVGNTNGHADYVSFGRVTFRDDKFIYTDTTALGGCSGGGLYNYSGELSGLNVGHEKSAITFHIKLGVIRKFYNANRHFF